MPANEAADDAIHLDEIELQVRIGVPEEERVQPQRLILCLTLWPLAGFAGLNDEIGRTVDYAEVARSVEEFVAARSDKLIETMADAIAASLLARFPLARVRVELRKFVLPRVKHVAAIVTRNRLDD